MSIWYDEPFDSETAREAANRRWERQRERKAREDDEAYWRRQPEVLRALLEHRLREVGVNLSDALAACHRGRLTQRDAELRDHLASALSSGSMVANVRDGHDANTPLKYRPVALFALSEADWGKALGLSERTVSRLLERAEELCDEWEYEDDVLLTTPEELAAAQEAEDLRDVMGIDESVSAADRRSDAFDNGLFYL